jgi:Fe-S-cluster containining protein
LTPEERTKQVTARFDYETGNGLVQRALAEKFPSRKLFFLRKTTELLGEAAEGVAPCKKGCDHCCKLSVFLSVAEAKIIAREIGREFKMPKTFRSETAMEFTGVPCPFLKNHECSIYEHRPFACRVHYSMADSAAPCHLDQIRTVPYMNPSTYYDAYFKAFGRESLTQLADIRDFFG